MTRSAPPGRSTCEPPWSQTLLGSYLYCFDADDPDAYVLVEVFADGAAPPPPDAPFFQDLMREAGSLLDGMPAVQRTEVVWSKGLAG